MKRIPTSPGEGWKIQSNRGFFYLGIAGRIYSLQLEIGRFAITIDAKR